MEPGELSQGAYGAVGTWDVGKLSGSIHVAVRCLDGMYLDVPVWCCRSSMVKLRGVPIGYCATQHYLYLCMSTGVLTRTTVSILFPSTGRSLRVRAALVRVLRLWPMHGRLIPAASINHADVDCIRDSIEFQYGPMFSFRQTHIL